MSDFTMGIYKATVISDTSRTQGPFFCVKVIDAAVLTVTAGTTTVGASFTNLAGLGSITLDAGTAWYGDFQYVQLASGLVICYGFQDNSG